MLTQQSSRSTVLIVDDDVENREALGNLVEAMGYRPALAAHGLEALDYLRRNERPGLILLDLVMPTMNGWVFGIEQRKDPLLADIPVVVFSGIHDPESAAGFLNVDDFLAKPIDVERLCAVLQRYCH